MAYVNVLEWKAEQVADWLQGKIKNHKYCRLLIENNQLFKFNYRFFTSKIMFESSIRQPYFHKMCS